MGWFFPQVPIARIAWLRRLVYAVVLLDVLVLTAFPIGHGNVPAELYKPLPFRELLHLPAPSPVSVQVLRVVIVLSALVALSGRLPRLAGWVCAVGMLDWLSNAYSYSKINHDHFALVVALCVLPLVGRVAVSDRRTSESAGWTLRIIQVAVVATYFLAAIAKVLDAGWGWGSSAVLVWALTRRGSALSEWLVGMPWLTQVFQWSVFVAELASPVMLWLRGRALYAVVAFWLFFHLSTFLLLSIHFLPTVVCLLAFLPLERLTRSDPRDPGLEDPPADAPTGKSWRRAQV
ncbi:HTTM domain-containing protein [Luteipulveratus sp. YIM 133132]|uniref:HTTM domain-containing protein n=1 Tax=Luteipulveratus flavus TaxID=3031728 RepID=UPI0023AEA2B5|nr:HTTM domain-containing protein [Luteipulveratus sp. YIM 133132]MDE9367299.1 HTTM domain-containing protein [Luteipulveratus sp. YIM 133132]